ncbi:hemerythrin domain-containing protein [Nocardia sp. NPDC052278]|uniref:hemerythrin domain-containing protein n=1 Tax=unclassified Nocardia TaxID=2637762 RepID=UPI0036B968EF
MEATSINTTDDVVTFLIEQHMRIRELFAEVAQAPTAEQREQKFYELRRLLAVHETAEEEIIHPRFRREVHDGADIIEARLEEENKAKRQLADIEAVDIDSPEFDAKLAALREGVLAHADHEEHEEFNRLRSELEPDEMARLRNAVKFAEAMAPTRPHPGVESASANLLVGPFAAMMDRAKDAISKPRTK